MHRRLIRILALVGTVAAVCLASSQGTFFPRVPAVDPGTNVELDSLQPTSSPTASPPPRVASVVTIGDSIMAGHGVEDGESWVSLVGTDTGWRVTNLADDGSGFLAIGNNGETFADQARVATSLDPQLILIGGSSNDFGAEDETLEQSTLATIAYLHAALPDAKIIGLSTIWGNNEYPDQLLRINNQVFQATAHAGGTYLSLAQPLAGGEGLMQADQIHPTAIGQRVLATAIEAALFRAGFIL